MMWYDKFLGFGNSCCKCWEVWIVLGVNTKMFDFVWGFEIYFMVCDVVC